MSIVSPSKSLTEKKLSRVSVPKASAKLWTTKGQAAKTSLPAVEKVVSRGSTCVIGDRVSLLHLDISKNSYKPYSIEPKNVMPKNTKPCIIVPKSPKSGANECVDSTDKVVQTTLSSQEPSGQVKESEANGGKGAQGDETSQPSLFPIDVTIGVENRCHWTHDIAMYYDNTVYGYYTATLLRFFDYNTLCNRLFSPEIKDAHVRESNERYQDYGLGYLALTIMELVHTHQSNWYGFIISCGFTEPWQIFWLIREALYLGGGKLLVEGLLRLGLFSLWNHMSVIKYSRNEMEWRLLAAIDVLEAIPRNNQYESIGFTISLLTHFCFRWLPYRMSSKTWKADEVLESICLCTRMYSNAKLALPISFLISVRVDVLGAIHPYLGQASASAMISERGMEVFLNTYQQQLVMFHE